MKQAKPQSTTRLVVSTWDTVQVENGYSSDTVCRRPLRHRPLSYWGIDSNLHITEKIIDVAHVTYNSTSEQQDLVDLGYYNTLQSSIISSRIPTDSQGSNDVSNRGTLCSQPLKQQQSAPAFTAHEYAIQSTDTVIAPAVDTTASQIEAVQPPPHIRISSHIHRAQNRRTKRSLQAVHNIPVSVCSSAHCSSNDYPVLPAAVHTIRYMVPDIPRFDPWYNKKRLGRGKKQKKIHKSALPVVHPWMPQELTLDQKQLIAFGEDSGLMYVPTGGSTTLEFIIHMYQAPQMDEHTRYHVTVDSALSGIGSAFHRHSLWLEKLDQLKELFQLPHSTHRCYNSFTRVCDWNFASIATGCNYSTHNIDEINDAVQVLATDYIMDMHSILQSAVSNDTWSDPMAIQLGLWLLFRYLMGIPNTTLQSLVGEPESTFNSLSRNEHTLRRILSVHECPTHCPVDPDTLYDIDIEDMTPRCAWFKTLLHEEVDEGVADMLWQQWQAAGVQLQIHQAVVEWDQTVQRLKQKNPQPVCLDLLDRYWQRRLSKVYNLLQHCDNSM